MRDFFQALFIFTIVMAIIGMILRRVRPDYAAYIVGTQAIVCFIGYYFNRGR